MDRENAIVWMAYPWLRHLINRSRLNRRYDIALAVEPFEVRCVNGAEAPLVCNIPWLDFELEIRLHEGRLFRRVLSEGMIPADIVQLGHMTIEVLVEGRDDSFEWDHPAAIRNTHLLSDEPFSYAPTSSLARPRFWSMQNDPVPARARLQASLSSYLVIDGELWRPTPAPAIWITARTGEARLCLGDMPRSRSRGIQIDWHERHLVADMLASMGRSADDSATYRYVMNQDWDFPYDAGDAEWRMLEQCVVSMKNAGSRRMAASGPALPAAFWAGRQVLEAGGRIEALVWYERHAMSLLNSDIAPVVRAIRLFDEQRRIMREAYGRGWDV